MRSGVAWRRAPAADPTRALRGHRALSHAFYVDDLYDRALVRPVRRCRAGSARDRRHVVVAGRCSAPAAARGCSPAWCARTQAGNIQRTSPGLLAGVLLIVAGVVVLT